MSTPIIHAQNSAKRFGGIPDDYIDIHEIMDSSKAAFPDLRHRALTHNSWFVTEILEKIFGQSIRNSDDKEISVREIGQWHVMEDYCGSFPSVQDFLMNMKFQEWMDNGRNGKSVPPSSELLPTFDQTLLDPTRKIHTVKLPLPPGSIPNEVVKYPVHTAGDCGGGGRFD